MEKKTILQNRTIAYTLRKSRRARRMRLSVHRDGSVAVTMPYGLGENIAEIFIAEKADWLIKKLAFFKRFEGGPAARYDHKDYLEHKESARTLILQKADDLAKRHGYCYNRINIKNQKTRWGSCSRKRNLNFNYKIIFLPERVQDYIIAHELCHLKEMNHSKKFWSLVALIIPDYLEIRKELKISGLNFY